MPRGATLQPGTMLNEGETRQAKTLRSISFASSSGKLPGDREYFFLINRIEVACLLQANFLCTFWATTSSISFNSPKLCSLAKSKELKLYPLLCGARR
jgi:hypothetical protein